MRRRVAGIEPQRLAEFAFRCPQVRELADLQVMTAEQVVSKGLGVARVDGAHARPLGRRQRHQEGVGHRLRDRGLDVDEIRERLAPFVGGERRAIGRPQEARPHPHEAIRMLEVSFEHGVRTERAARLEGILVEGLVAPDLRERFDSQAGNAAEPVDQRLGHAELQPRVGLARNHRLERKHGDCSRHRSAGQRLKPRVPAGGHEDHRPDGARNHRVSGIPGSATTLSGPAAHGTCPRTIGRRRGRVDPAGRVHVGDETVAALRVRFDEPWRPRGIAQGMSDLGDDDVEGGLELDVRVVGPEGPAQVGARHELAGAGHEQAQRLGRLLLKGDAPSAPGQLAGRQIQVEGAKPNHASIGSRAGCGGRLDAPGDVTNRAGHRTETAAERLNRLKLFPDTLTRSAAHLDKLGRGPSRPR